MPIDFTSNTSKPVDNITRPIIKKYLKIIKTNINVRKFGVGSTIGNVTFSSIFNTSFVVKNFTLNPRLGFKALKNVTNEYVGLVFENDTKIERVVIEVGENGSYPTEGFVEYSKDNKTFTRLPKAITLKEAPVSKKVFEIEPITVRSVRFVITKWIKWPAVKIDFLFTDETCKEDVDQDELIDDDATVEYDSRVVLDRNNETDKDDYIRSFRIQTWDDLPVDLLNLIKRFNETRYINDKGVLPLSKIGLLTYSSIRAPENLNYTLDKLGWAADDNKTEQFVGIMSPFPVNVSEVQLRPTDDGSYISEFQVEYREDLNNETFRRLNQTFVVNLSNADPNGVISFKLNNIRATEVRLIVKKFVKWPTTRLEVTYSDPAYKIYLEAGEKLKEELRKKSVEDPDLPINIDNETIVQTSFQPGFESPSVSGDGWKSAVNQSGAIYVGVKFRNPTDVSGVRVISPTGKDVTGFYVRYADYNAPGFYKGFYPSASTLSKDSKGNVILRFNKLLKISEFQIYVTSPVG